jgi:hypothetical protein
VQAPATLSGLISGARSRQAALVSPSARARADVRVKVIVPNG